MRCNADATSSRATDDAVARKPANIPDMAPTEPTASTSRSGAKSPEMGAEVANKKMAAAVVHAAHSHDDSYTSMVTP